MMMWWSCKGEYWFGLVISGWYVGDIIQISTTYHLDIVQISPTYHRNIIRISPTYHRNLIRISPTYHRNIIRISPTYHPKIRSIYFTTPHLMKRLVLTQICNGEINSIKTPLLIIQILLKYHPEIIQNHPVDIDFYNPPKLVKSQV